MLGARGMYVYQGFVHDSHHFWRPRGRLQRRLEQRGGHTATDQRSCYDGPLDAPDLVADDGSHRRSYGDSGAADAYTRATDSDA